MPFFHIIIFAKARNDPFYSLAYAHWKTEFSLFPWFRDSLLYFNSEVFYSLWQCPSKNKPLTLTLLRSMWNDVISRRGLAIDITITRKFATLLSYIRLLSCILLPLINYNNDRYVPAEGEVRTFESVVEPLLHEEYEVNYIFQTLLLKSVHLFSFRCSAWFSKKNEVVKLNFRW